MGWPKELTAAQVAHLNELTRDLPEKDEVVRAGKDGALDVQLPMHSNDIVLVTLEHYR
jgi:xylan 1,4-beta-xylosidase